LGSVTLELRTALMIAVTEGETRLAQSSCPDVVSPCCPTPVRNVILEYLVNLCIGLARGGVLDEESWEKHLLPHLENFNGVSDARKLIRKLRNAAVRLMTCTNPQEGTSESDFVWADADAANNEDILCDCNLTLACGAATLLQKAKLKLVRSGVYGLVGANDSGKSALLRALHQRKVVGFDPAGKLVTALVEHGVGDMHPECELAPVKYLMADETSTLWACSSSRSSRC